MSATERGTQSESEQESETEGESVSATETGAESESEKVVTDEEESEDVSEEEGTSEEGSGEGTSEAQSLVGTPRGQSRAAPSVAGSEGQWSDVTSSDAASVESRMWHYVSLDVNKNQGVLKRDGAPATARPQSAKGAAPKTSALERSLSSLWSCGRPAKVTDEVIEQGEGVFYIVPVEDILS